MPRGRLCCLTNRHGTTTSHRGREGEKRAPGSRQCSRLPGKRLSGEARLASNQAPFTNQIVGAPRPPAPFITSRRRRDLANERALERLEKSWVTVISFGFAVLR